MDENLEIMDPQVEHKELLVKWLRYMPWFRIAAIAMGVLILIPATATVGSWLSLGCSAGCIYLLMKVSPACNRYRTAGILFTINLVAGLLGIAILSLAGSVCAFVGTYQEMNGHSDITKKLDAELSRKWHNLFYWSMLIGFLAGVAGTSGVVIGAIAGVAAETLVNVIVPALTGVELIVELMYLRYMNKTLALLDT